MESAVVIKGLKKTFKNKQGHVIAVDGIHLEIGLGLVYGILGPNGAGKTTTIRMISGMLSSDEGSISIMGKPLETNREAIGLCPQELVVWDGLTVMEQLLFMAQMYNVNPDLAKERAQALLSEMCLLDKQHQRAVTLSGGMKRRLNILLALMHDPPILILDEPQAGLDPQSRMLVRDYIARISSHKTVLITTHDMEEADKLCDRVAIIDHGRILVEDTPNALKENLFEGEFIEVELEDGKVLQYQSKDPLTEIVAMRPEIEEKQGKIKDLKIRKASLEDVFIHLTGRGMRE